MKKPFNYKELSRVCCTAKNCSNRIKKNVIARKGDDKALLCYKCHAAKTRKRQNVTVKLTGKMRSNIWTPQIVD